ncbi:MAG: hypothetical protein ACR2IQ_02440 [Minisyncoccia bacterium]
MIEIIPAILSKNFSDIEHNLAQIVGGVSIVQIDICDGMFVQNRTWPFEGYGAKNQAYLKDHDIQTLEKEETGMPYWDTMDYELDLMVQDPATILKDLMIIGPKRVVIHFDSIKNIDNGPEEFFNNLDPFYKNQIEIGLAVTSKNTLTEIENIIPHISFIQCMGIEHVGFQHQEFDTHILETIKTLRSKYPDMPISVDGAVNMGTIDDLIDAGATRLVVGSAIWETEIPSETLHEFKEIAKERSV